jgi:hypothetical protein
MNKFASLLVATALLAPAAAFAGAPAPTAATAATAAAAAELPFTGKVLSTIDVNQYTYIEVAQGAKVLWLAAPHVALKKNSTIRFEEGAEMTNFRSASLNRTFPVIRFVGRVAVVDAK